MLTTRYSARCKRCRSWNTREVQVAPSADEHGYIVLTVEGLGVQSQPRGFEGYAYVRCNCGAALHLKRVRGTVVRDHACDSRCEMGKGADCFCACGGRNHGKRAI